MKKWFVILAVALLTVSLGFRVSQALKQQAKPAAAPNVIFPTVAVSKVRMGLLNEKAFLAGALKPVGQVDAASRMTGRIAGMVVNNAIVLVDCINQLRRGMGLTLREAVELGGRRR